MAVNSLLCVLLSVCSVTVCSQYVPPSPCPDVFSYKVEAQRTYGVIRYQPAAQLKYVFIRASFTIAANLPSGYTGQLDVLGSKELALLKMLRGQALDYRVDFPLASPLPTLTSVAVNGHVLCTGEAGFSEPNESFSLEHLLFDKGDVLSPLALNFGNTEQYRPVENTTPIPIPLGTPDRTECGVVSGGNDQVGLVYGTAVSVGDWPWLVAVFTKRESKIYYTCAGSLVSNEHVVTAAHCMSRKDIVRPLKDFVLKVGAFNLDYTGDPRVSIRGVKAAALHTHYNSHTLDNDILILQLDAPVGFTKLVKPICLWEGQLSQNFIIRKRGTVVGWGGNELRESGTGEPRMASIPVVSTETCRASRVEFHKLTSSGTTFCAGYRNGTGPCNGDSGSGMYMFSGGRWRLRGVVSVSLRPVTGEAKCNLDEYVVFTDAAQYLPWLRQHLYGGSAWPQKAPTIRTPVSSAVPCGAVSGGNDQVPLVYNGINASPGDWPWLVAIYRKKGFELQFSCGGSLVSNEHVITAAHCQRHHDTVTNVKNLLVKIGIFDLSSFSDDNVVSLGIKEVILHPEFDPVKLKNNIAIFKLEKMVVYTSYIRPVCVPGTQLGLNSIIGKRGMAPGWGLNDENITHFEQGPIRVAPAPVVSTETCLRSNRDFINILTDNTFCAGYRNGTAPCNGDSGGGLYMLEGGKWSLRGIISLALSNGEGVCNVNEYIVYTDVAQFVPWLIEQLSEYWPQIAYTPETTPPVQCGVVSGGNERVPLLYNGFTAFPGDWPWLVAIYSRKQLEFMFICGGSLVSNRHVITAAHCVRISSSLVQLKDLLVKAGVFDISSESENVVTRGVIQALLHPEYDSTTFKNNIAIMKLEKEIVFTAYIRPICLPETNSDLNTIIGKYGMVAGWGFNENTNYGGRLKEGSTPIVSVEQCLRSNAAFFNIISDNTFCAGQPNGTTPCKGDSGGGLYLMEEGRWSLRGIISLALANNDGTCNTNEYVVYVDVAQYMPWLKAQLGEK